MEIINMKPDELYDEIKLKDINNFLFEHLGKYGDPKEQIRMAMDYALSKQKGRGGVIILAEENNKILGAVVVNETGMDAYIPANILVYIAVDESQRGKGIGKKLMEEAITQTAGGIALHVEPDNPAKKLYEKLGFTNKYLEMRLQQ
jgi:[ribosomal protein S18]-alanine N-acetyltransferase